MSRCEISGQGLLDLAVGCRGTKAAVANLRGEGDQQQLVSTDPKNMTVRSLSQASQDGKQTITPATVVGAVSI